MGYNAKLQNSPLRSNALPVIVTWRRYLFGSNSNHNKYDNITLNRAMQVVLPENPDSLRSTKLAIQTHFLIIIKLLFICWSLFSSGVFYLHQVNREWMTEILFSFDVYVRACVCACQGFDPWPDPTRTKLLTRWPGSISCVCVCVCVRVWLNVYISYA